MPNLQIYSVADLSNGKEAKELPAHNKYNFEQIAPFEYITELEVDATLTFPPKELCQCAPSDCNKQSQSQGGQCDCGKNTHFCSSSCACKAVGDCPNKYSPLPHNYQVYYANPSKKWALRTLKDMKQGAHLFEYTGVLTADKEALDDDYIYSFDFNNQKYMIDAFRKGNLARFVNHSCKPNCYTVLSPIRPDGVPHLFVAAKKNINEGEELTLDYGKSWWEIKRRNTNGALSCACKCEKHVYDEHHDEEVEAKANGFSGQSENGAATSTSGNSIVENGTRQLAAAENTPFFYQRPRPRQYAAKAVSPSTSTTPRQTAAKSMGCVLYTNGGSRSGSGSVQMATKAHMPQQNARNTAKKGCFDPNSNDYEIVLDEEMEEEFEGEDEETTITDEDDDDDDGEDDDVMIIDEENKQQQKDEQKDGEQNGP